MSIDHLHEPSWQLGLPWIRCSHYDEENRTNHHKAILAGTLEHLCLQHVHTSHCYDRGGVHLPSHISINSSLRFLQLRDPAPQADAARTPSYSIARHPNGQDVDHYALFASPFDPSCNDNVVATWKVRGPDDDVPSPDRMSMSRTPRGGMDAYKIPVVGDRSWSSDCGPLRLSASCAVPWLSLTFPTPFSYVHAQKSANLTGITTSSGMNPTPAGLCQFFVRPLRPNSILRYY